MKIIPTEFPEVFILEPRIFVDQRGYFFESFRLAGATESHILPSFVQENFSHSTKNVLRGLHYQLQRPQGKLVWVTRGAVFDVAVDIRQGSPGFGQWVSVILNDENHWQLYIPPGFAHGFCVLSDSADFVYKVTDYYDPLSERGICWQDNQLNIKWPVHIPALSQKDAVYPNLAEIAPIDLPVYTSRE